MDYSYICAVQPTIGGEEEMRKREEGEGGKMEEDKRGQRKV